MDLWQLLGELHPKLVQIPLMLLPAGLMFDLFGWLRRVAWAHRAGRILSIAGTVGLLVAFICGIYAEIWAGRASIPQRPIELHELMANAASWLFVVLCAWRLFLEPDHRRSFAAYCTIGLSFYVLLMLTGWLGGQLVFDYGAGVQGATSNTVMSLEDLNTLAQRQTDANLHYSEQMHHIFGVMTLGLSCSLLLGTFSSVWQQRLRWVPALAFALGGIFLFFFADLDLYRLTDLRQLRDREVQLHKVLALVMMSVGVLGLRKAAMTPGVAPAAVMLGVPGPSPRVSISGSEQSAVQGPQATFAALYAGTHIRSSLLVAVMALIGGGMLFTHVHSVAPYANVAAGVYIAHVVMGLVALAIGAARLLEDTYPRYQRVFAVVFASCMLIEALLLITYNEGLPWWIGYGRYNRWGPHQGTIAPLGGQRAELTLDSETGQFDLYLYNRFTDTPVTSSAKSLNLIVSQGYQDTDILLEPVDSSHYRAVAPAFRHRASLGARVRVGDRTGYFDPWVMPAIAAVPPNELARYECPMHEGIRSAHTGQTCPLCGMELVPISATPQKALHAPDYAMDLVVRSVGPNTELVFTPRKEGQVVHDLAMVHERVLHLIVASDDLTYFDHVHPVHQADGSLMLSYHFPKDGSYLLFADMTPRADRNQVFRLPLLVQNGITTSAQDVHPVDDLTLPAAYGKPIPVLSNSMLSAETKAGPSPVQADLIVQPRTLVAGIESTLLFRLSRDGQPLTDLRSYMGAMGHCVVLSEDTESFLHSHPDMLFPVAPEDRGGPAVAFHTTFPRPGRYKVWGQFRRVNADGKDEYLIADFVVEVKPSWLPVGLLRFLLND